MAKSFLSIEQTYEELAEALDAVGEEHREVFLCKLALLMARKIDDPAQVSQMIAAAQKNLDGA